MLSDPERVILVALLLATAAATGMAATDGDKPVRPGIPSPAEVPAPLQSNLAELSAPCWACPASEDWPLDFRSDLDLLAPLGNGKENAALWFKEFSKSSGSRWSEAVAANERLTSVGGMEHVLPLDDPLLLEAEPWCDRATLRYYPEIYPSRGYDTEVASLVVPLLLARSWIARGHAATDPIEALADYRRVIRLGRLMQGEDAVIYNDLGGLACIQLGAQAVYDLARVQGNAELALVAALVLGEVDSLKRRTHDRMEAVDILPFIIKSPDDRAKLELPDARTSVLLRMATEDPDRRFRLEAIGALNYVAHLGSREQRTAAKSLLKRLAASTDAFTADSARWALEIPPDPEEPTSR